MNQYQQVIQLAKQSALKKFSVLAQLMAQNTDLELARSLAINSPSTDYASLNGARHFLRKAGDELLQNLDKQYQLKLEQALHAAFSNERVELVQIKAANLTLIDDMTINRQIEVGHLVGRLVASCSENLGLVNVIISQLLEKTEIRERDNPFRPDLIAHTLNDVLINMVGEERVRNLLLNYATNALAIYLPEYYAELCEVFKAGGISPKIFNRPTSRHRQSEPSPLPAATEPEGRSEHGDYSPGNLSGNQVAGISPEAVPTLQRLLNLMQNQFAQSGTADTADTAGTAGADMQSVSPLAAFQGLVNTIFGSAGAGNPFAALSPTGAAGAPAVSAELLARLNDLQNKVAGGQVGGAGMASGALDQQVLGAASQSERLALELVTVLFELMHRDEQIPEHLRQQIGQLQVPFLKSAVLDPGTLQQVDHPTRRLLNHMGMVSVGPPETPGSDRGVNLEIDRIVKKILVDYRQDTNIFSACLDELKKFMDDGLGRNDEITKRNIEAIESIQRVDDLTYRITTSVSDVLLPLKVDQAVVNFCLQKWVHVLVKASVKITRAQDDANSTTRSRLLQFFNALPDLVWSAQEKKSTEDRLELIKLLPKLVKIIKSGLVALRLSDDEAKQELDQLLAVHARVLANTEGGSSKKLPTLTELRQMFQVEAIQEEATTSKATAPRPLDGSGIKAALAQKGIDATVHISAAESYASKVEHEWLSDMQVGTRIECDIDGACQMGRLIWVSKNQSLFMFRLDKSPNPLIYCPISLSRALGNNTLTFVESAPTFERAVATLLKEAQQLKKNGGPVIESDTP